MVNKRVIGTAVLFAAAFGCLAWLLLRPATSEPVHDGKPLSYWLRAATSTAITVRVHEGLSLTFLLKYALPTTNNPPLAESEAALRQIGTNALPVLLRMLRSRDSAFTLKLVALAQKQHYVAVHFEPAPTRNYQAQVGFRILGASASNAVPALIKILQEKRSPDSELFTIYSLAHIGPPAAAAVPALLQSANDPTPAVRYNSFWALGCIKADPEKSVPALIVGLGDADKNGRVAAVDALGEFGAAARSAIPALITAAGDTQVRLRDNVVDTLKKIDPTAVEMLPKGK